MNRTRQTGRGALAADATRFSSSDRQDAQRHPGPAIDPAHRVDVDAGPGHAAAARGKSASRLLAVRQSAKAIGAARDVVPGARLRWMIFTVGSMPGRIAPRLAGRKGARGRTRPRFAYAVKGQHKGTGCQEAPQALRSSTFHPISSRRSFTVAATAAALQSPSLRPALQIASPLGALLLRRLVL